MITLMEISNIFDGKTKVNNLYVATVLSVLKEKTVVKASACVTFKVGFSTYACFTFIEN